MFRIICEIYGFRWKKKDAVTQLEAMNDLIGFLMECFCYVGMKVVLLLALTFLSLCVNTAFISWNNLTRIRVPQNIIVSITILHEFS